MDNEKEWLGLTDAEVLVRRGPTGGLGFGWHREGGGCGLRTDAAFKALRVSSDAFCPTDSLDERNKYGNLIEKHFLHEDNKK